MSLLSRDDAEIYFEEYGAGFPVLLLSPGGMWSNMNKWRELSHYHDWTRVLADDFRVVAMDQRNAGGSKGEIAAHHGWHTYVDDQLALMDHLGIERFHAVGASIGCGFILKLCEIAASRVVSAVLQNPLGFTLESPDHFPSAFSVWAEELMGKRPEIDEAVLAALRDNMWGARDFVFAVDRDFVKRLRVPVLILPGNDIPHPALVGNELAEIVSGAECLTNWRCPDFAEAQRDAVVGFLSKHAH
jgi:pimeloyl-ACP methyl ester carboxylesterase